MRPIVLVLAAAAALAACRHGDHAEMARDLHSLSRPAEVRVTHADLVWDVDFDAREIRGEVAWTLARASHVQDELVLDTKHLVIEGVRAGAQDGLRDAVYTLGEEHPVFGRALRIPLANGDVRVVVRYRTTGRSSGLQWLTPAQTADKTAPFLFTQAQAIHARTILPCQDTPGVRFTWTGRVRVPAGLTAVMAARQLGPDTNGVFRFEMPQAIPSYLVALAVGKIAFKPLGPRTGVFAEPSVLERAAYEFADTETMVLKAEELYGPYRWERYDLIVLPPSFPFGGMENPRLTFATPTVLAGDRSQVGLVAHELAHSWSGNLVTNATWSDFWLNEGFTVYFENRIQEAVYGHARAEMEAVLGKGELLEEMKTMPEGDTILHVDLAGRDPDDAFSSVPYQKGYLFLRLLDETFGRGRFDAVLREWFDANAFTSRTTEDFVRHLERRLFPDDPAKAAAVGVHAWLHAPGLPANAPSPASDAFTQAAALAVAFASGAKAAGDLPAKSWTTHEWMHFLRSLPEDLPAEKLALLDQAFRLSETGNCEVLCQWLQMAIRGRYDAAGPALARFLLAQGRRKYLKPLYTELAKTEPGRQIALGIYAQARPTYHPIATNTIDQILGWKP